MTEAQTILEPCPFCGSIPKNTEYFGNYNKPTYVVHCESCDVSLNGDNTPEQAAARWNTRATAAAQPVAWRCFFCDDVFTSQREAALHFGAFDSCEPDVTACKLMSHQQHVLEYIRGLEEEVGLYQAENHPTIKAVFAIEDEMRRAVKRAEEEGYNRGVADMKEQGFCAEPAKHDPPPPPAGDTGDSK